MRIGPGFVNNYRALRVECFDRRTVHELCCNQRCIAVASEIEHARDPEGRVERLERELGHEDEPGRRSTILGGDPEDAAR